MTVHPLANMGTALIQLTAAHLLIGNLLIGVLEAAVAARLMGRRGRPAYGWLIGANYASFVAGLLLVGTAGDALAGPVLGDFPLANVRRLVFLLAGLSLVATVAIEWPFYFAASSPGPGRAGRATAGVAAAHLVSYALLVPLYWEASAVMGGDLAEVPVTELAAPGAVVYFVPPHAGASDVWRVALDGSPPQPVRSADVPPEARWLEPAGHGENHPLTDKGWSPVHPPRDFGPARDLRRPGDARWRVDTDFWPGRGLAARSADGKSLHVAVDAPSLKWFARRATVLPGDLVVFQLRDQILLLDLNGRRLALLGRGRDPVVVPAPQPATAPSTRNTPTANDPDDRTS